MAETYNALGADIIANVIANASDVNEIQDLILRELSRRALASASTLKATANTPIRKNIAEAIHSNLVVGGYKTAESFNSLSAEQMQRYVSHIKELYKKIVVS